MHMIDSLTTLAQNNDFANGAAAAGGGIIGCIFMLFWLVLFVLVIAGAWKTFTKAGQPGWGVLIPIYDVYLLCKIAGRPGWWVLLLLIPFVNIVIAVIVYLDIAKNFGKGVGFAIGLLLLPAIFFMILGFGSAQYQPQPATI